MVGTLLYKEAGGNVRSLEDVRFFEKTAHPDTLKPGIAIQYEDDRVEFKPFIEVVGFYPRDDDTQFEEDYQHYLD